MTYRKKKNFVTREVAGETLIVPLRGKLADMQHIFALDAVAAFIWANLDGKKDMDRICRDVTEHFETGDRDVTADARDFIQELIEADLIEAV